MNLSHAIVGALTVKRRQPQGLNNICSPFLRIIVGKVYENRNDFSSLEKIRDKGLATELEYKVLKEKQTGYRHVAVLHFGFQEGSYFSLLCMLYISSLQICGTFSLVPGSNCDSQKERTL